jgi:dephospho-CoA kinase
MCKPSGVLYSRPVLLVGLTGGIGSGKSQAAQAFASMGGVVIDADQLARDVVSPGSPALAEIEQRFGSGVIKAGVLDRSALAAVVFADPKARQDLESITHPRIAAAFQEALLTLPADAIVIHEVPLLVELSLSDRYDLVVVIETTPELRLERLIDRGLSESDIKARLSAQLSDEERSKSADVVIRNDGSMEDLGREIARIWQSVILPAAATKGSRARED